MLFNENHTFILIIQSDSHVQIYLGDCSIERLRDPIDRDYFFPMDAGVSCVQQGDETGQKINPAMLWIQGKDKESLKTSFPGFSKKRR